MKLDLALPTDIVDLAGLQCLMVDESRFNETMAMVAAVLEEWVPTLANVHRNGSLSDGSQRGDPLLHMPLDPRLIADACYLEAPYVGLRSFGTRDAPIFLVARRT